MGIERSKNKEAVIEMLKDEYRGMISGYSREYVDEFIKFVMRADELGVTNNELSNIFKEAYDELHAKHDEGGEI
ncbi:MAG: hypothetical protein A2934_02135 [Candidatus Sungbacteria bacterium RIFCSPLOWO2_01_FULL_47_10]|uniref:Uncharacterized protein n=1 Tax=Candidatus Sungbacteria bacterium RIFCSPLOWO2_01_FULL_47_10 TaxID=1802276 RepID=A0A1G2L0W6_9BACT|nr:MAG: hypothetical protein A2934_02135 [Candidatus Sungbacteria bacterium RIFCSPLOWO2_01_FULL_47_10]